MENKPQTPKSSLKPPKFNPIWIYVPLIGLIAYMYFFGSSVGDPVKTEWYKVKEQMIPQGDIDKVRYITNQNKA